MKVNSVKCAQLPLHDAGRANQRSSFGCGSAKREGYPHLQPARTRWQDDASARNWSARQALFRQADASCSPSQRPRPAAALAPHAGGGPFLSSPSATDLGVNMAFLETPSRPQPAPGTAQDWYALQAMHPASARTIGRTYGTLEAALNWGVALVRRGYYIEIWSPSFLEDRRDALLD
jgi:hypothetical protein